MASAGGSSQAIHETGPVDVLCVALDPGIDRVREETPDETIRYHTVRTRTEAMARVERSRPDCVVVSGDLPSPREFLDRLCDEQYGFPVVLCTGAPDLGTDALDLGVADVVDDESCRKPRLFATKIENVVQQQRLRETCRSNQRRIRRLNALLGGSSDRLSVLATDGTYKFVSPAADPVVEYGPDSLLGASNTTRTSLFDRVHPEDEAHIEDTLEAVQSHPDRTHSVEYRIREADGGWRWVESKFVNRLDTPAVDGIVATTQDVTGKRAREGALEAERQRFRSLFEQLTQPIVEVEFEGPEPVVRRVNGAFEETFGFDADEIVGQSLDDYIVEDGQRGTATELNRRVREGESINAKEITRRTTDGERPFLFQTAIYDDGSRGFGVYTDITDQKVREERLEYQRSLLQAVTQTDLEGRLVVDEDGDIVLYNDRFLEMWDIPEWVVEKGSEQAAIEHVLDQVVDQEAFLQQVEYLYDNPDEQSRDIIELEDGRVFDRYSDSVVSESGEVYGRLWSFRDITELRERGRELAEERALTESIFSALPDILYAFDEFGNFLRWNDEVKAVTGYSDSELAEMNPPDFVAPADRPKALEAMSRIIQEGATTKIEADILTKDDKKIPYELTGAKMTDDEGETVGLVGIGRDISARKERQRRFQAVFNNTYQFTGLLEPDGTIVEANDTALRFGGVDRDEVVGTPIWDAYWFQENERAAEIAAEAVETARGGDLYREEVRVQGESGTEIIDFSIRPITDEHGEVTLLVPEGRMITELKQREEHLRVLNRFLRHNLRNKMTVIRGMSGHLQEELDNPAQVEQAAAIGAAATELVDLTETAQQLLKITVEADPEQEPVDPGEPLQRAVATVRERYPEAEVRSTAPVDTPVAADWRLETVFEQLLENGIVHNDDPKATVEATVEDAPDGHLRVRITDDGPGIPETELVGITSDEQRTQLKHGSGFGLWLVKSVVDDYGGSLAYEPGFEGGSSMILELPRADDA